MEMNMAKFSEKLVELLELAKKKKNVLEYQEISDFFKDSPLEVDQMEKVFDFLEASGVDVLRITENSGDELLLDNDMDMDGMEDEEEVELDKIDLSVPEGVSIEDPVRMYLKEIGKVSLLSADEEIELHEGGWAFIPTDIEHAIEIEPDETVNYVWFEIELTKAELAAKKAQ